MTDLLTRVTELMDGVTVRSHWIVAHQAQARAQRLWQGYVEGLT